MKGWIILGTVGAVLSMLVAQAQQTASSSSGQQSAQSGAAAQQPTESGKRRDPFRSLIVRQQTQQAPACRAPGKGALVIGQIQIQGIVRGINNEWIAVVDNRTKRSFFLREGDELCNGAVTKIVEDSVTFEEKTTDAFGRTRNREVVKQLPPS
ncbi:MAG: hypothetical protein A3H27_15490 [Acidobacteria bacterium RIFCSPLOWO2_02_FULL_59_13]|nr:MAG: hypothetical protein A3H27_15490 [Acidobacteria bacterium RIFCSPLOWO2_02_FULL_59_13]